MATVVIVGPHTYGTTADGSLVPFVQWGYCDVAGHAVTLYYGDTATVLGASYASTTPEPSGDYAGWYRWEILVSNWTGNTGQLTLPSAAVTSAAASLSMTAAIPVPVGAGTTGAAALGLTSSSQVDIVPAEATSGAAAVSVTAVLGLPAGAATVAAENLSLRGSVPVPVGAATGAAAALGLESAGDTTAPAVGTLTVTPGTGTACTFSATATDAVGVVKWLLVEGASDPGAADPGQTGATSITSTTSKTFSAQAFTSTASATGTRYWRLHCWDAAGNHGVSAAASATVTIATSVYVDDDFGRANGGLGSNWATPTGASAFAIASGQAKASSSLSIARWSANAFPNDHFAEVSLVGGTTFSAGPAVRLQSGARGGYYVSADASGEIGTGSDMTLTLRRINSTGSVTNLEYASATFTTGTVRIYASGSTIVVVYDGSVVIDVTDSTYASGSAGIAGDTAGIVDDFAGGSGQ